MTGPWLVALLALLTATEARADFGDPAFRECLTGKSSGPACAPVPGATASGLLSGLAVPADVEVSTDGTSVYAISPGATRDHAVARFDRDPATGQLTYAGCISAKQAVCDQRIPDATTNGDDSGMGGPAAIALSPDDRSLYVAADEDDAVARFDRDPANGALEWAGCVTGETAVAPVAEGGNGACAAAVGSHSADGADSGLDRLTALDVIDNSLYTASGDDDAIARFSRSIAPATLGALAVVNCVTTETETGPAGGGGSGACVVPPGFTPTAGGGDSGFDNLNAITVSPDGDSVYATSALDDALVHFERLSAGSLSDPGCITGESAVTAACATNGSDTGNGIDSGLGSPTDVAVSPDSESIYVTAGADAAIARLHREPGAVIYDGCLSGEVQSGPAPEGSGACALTQAATSLGADSGLDRPASAGVSPDGLTVYAAVSGDDAVAHFSRDEATGALVFEGCVTGETEAVAPCDLIAGAGSMGANSGLDGASSIAATADGKSLYAGAPFDAAVAHLDREDPPETQLDSGPPPVTADDTPTFTFSSPQALQLWFGGFECGVDGDAFTACISPHTTTPLSDAAHTFEVRARDTFGFADATPAASAFTVDAADSPPPPGYPPPSGPAPPDTDPPDTEITKQPDKKEKTKKKNDKAKFKFESTEDGSTFECKLDKTDWKPCSSPEKVKVKAGDGKFKKHRFKVRATDPAGNTDDTPAKRRWKVQRRDR